MTGRIQLFLKKFVQSSLFLDIRYKQGAPLLTHSIYGSAAALSMLFATVVAFFYQDRYGSLSRNLFFALVIAYILISLKYANSLRNGANSDTHRCKQLTEHGEERCIKLREVAGFSAVRTIFQIVGPRKILHCLLGK